VFEEEVKVHLCPNERLVVEIRGFTVIGFFINLQEKQENGGLHSRKLTIEWRIFFL